MNVRVVLVRPRNPLNIGAAARAMANFGLTELAVVKPHAPVWRETLSAPGAEKLVLSAKAVDTLEEAAGDCHLVLGTTAVRERNLKRDVVRLPDLPAYLARKGWTPAAGGGGTKVALLFGSEKTGLSNAYLEKCHAYVTIPTDAATPSMNLSHAVAACCYELSRLDPGRGPEARSGSPARAEDVARLVQNAEGLFTAVGYLSFLSPRKRVEKIRRALLQWNLRAADVRLLHGLMRFLRTKAAA